MTSFPSMLTHGDANITENLSGVVNSCKQMSNFTDFSIFMEIFLTKFGLPTDLSNQRVRIYNICK